MFPLLDQGFFSRVSSFPYFYKWFYNFLSTIVCLIDVSMTTAFCVFPYVSPALKKIQFTYGLAKKKVNSV